MCFDNALLATTNIANYVEGSNNFLEAFGVWDVSGEGGGNMILSIEPCTKDMRLGKGKV